MTQLNFDAEIVTPLNLETARLLCGFRTIDEFLEWAEPHIIRGEN